MQYDAKLQLISLKFNMNSKTKLWSVMRLSIHTKISHELII